MKRIDQTGGQVREAMTQFHPQAKGQAHSQVSSQIWGQVWGQVDEVYWAIQENLK